jgi:hypothetical protein
VVIHIRAEQLFLEQISLVMCHSGPSGAAFLDGKAAFVPAVSPGPTGNLLQWKSSVSSHYGPYIFVKTVKGLKGGWLAEAALAVSPFNCQGRPSEL